MRRISVFVTSVAISFVMALSGLAFSPAHASSLDDGNYLCSTGVITTTMGPTYTITADVVSAGTSCAGNVVIPEGVKGIKDHGFSGAGDITSISFADDGMLTYIGAFAFEWNIHLKQILIPASVTTIGLAAFYGDRSLTSLFFLGDDPAPNGDIFWASQLGGYESATKAYFRTGATGFASNIDGKWNGVPISPFYKLTFDGTDSDSGSAPRQIFSGAGEIITIPGNPGGLTKTGYDFAGWSQGIDQGGTGQKYSAGDVGPMPAFDGTLYVTWTLSNGSYLCSTGEPTSETTEVYTITTVGSDVTVSNGSTCTGAVVIREGVTAISAGAFQNATSLTAIAIPASVTDVGAFAFDGTSLNSITFGVNSQLTSIGAYAFYGQTALTSLAIPASVTSIGLGAFQGAVSLNSITFGVNSQLTSIGVAAFSESTITSITIPASVNSIGDSAFQGAYSLSSIYFLGSAPNSVGLGVFNDIGASPKAHVNSASASTFTLDGAGLWNGLTVVLPIADGSYLCSTGAPTSETTNIYKITTVGSDVIVSDGTCTGDVVIPEGVTALGADAFFNRPVTAISLPTSVTTIGNSAFMNTQITSINMPNVTSIDQWAFSGATLLTSVTIPVGVTVIREYAFAYTFALTSITIPSNVSTIESFAFTASGITSVVVPEGVTHIGIGAFAYTPLSYISLPDSLIEIGTQAFMSTQLVAVEIPINVSTMGVGVFQNSYALTSISVVESNSNYASSIDGVLFNKDSTKLIAYPLGKTATTYTIPSDVEIVGDRAFMGANSLTAINIPSSVTTFESLAFFCAGSLDSIVFLGNAPENIDASALLCLGETTKAYIKTGNTTFTPVVNGKWNGLTVSSYDHLVTYNSNGGSPVSAVGFTTGGTLSAPNAPTRDGYGFAGWSRSDGGAAVVFPYSPGGTSDVTLFSKWLVDGSYLCSTGLSTTPQLPPPSAINTYPITNGVVVTNHSANGSNNCAGAVVIPEGVTSIGDDAFAAASFMTDITVPASVTSIGLYAFYGATSLEDVTFATDSRLTVINNFAFNEATSLTSITIPGSVTSIGGSAFGNASKLSNIYFLGNAPTVGESAFTDIGEAPKAYVKNANVSSFTPLVDGKWNGLTVVIVDPPVVDPPVVDPPVVPPVVPPSGITSDTAADLAAAKLAAADLAARTVGKKKTFVAKTLAKRVGIKTVSSKATVTMSVSKSSKKICVVSKSKLMTLKGGKCIVTFTVQEPKPKKGKLPKATKTTKTLVVN